MIWLIILAGALFGIHWLHSWAEDDCSKIGAEEANDPDVYFGF